MSIKTWTWWSFFTKKPSTTLKTREQWGPKRSRTFYWTFSILICRRFQPLTCAWNWRVPRWLKSIWESSSCLIGPNSTDSLNSSESILTLSLQWILDPSMSIWTVAPSSTLISKNLYSWCGLTKKMKHTYKPIAACWLHTWEPKSNRKRPLRSWSWMRLLARKRKNRQRNLNCLTS